MNGIDLIMTVDIPHILAQCQELSQNHQRPLPVPDGACFAIGQQAVVRTGQASGRLQLAVSPGVRKPPVTLLRWHLITLGDAKNHAARLYAVNMQGVRHALPARAQMRTAMVPVPVLEEGRNAAPPEYTPGQVLDYVLETEVPFTRRAGFSLCFTIVRIDPATNSAAVTGHFHWEATISFASSV